MLSTGVYLYYSLSKNIHLVIPAINKYSSLMQFWKTVNLVYNGRSPNYTLEFIVLQKLITYES